jgi:hypothetical protein
MSLIDLHNAIHAEAIKAGAPGSAGYNARYNQIGASMRNMARTGGWSRGAKYGRD